MYCKKCGNQVEDGAEVCNNCGYEFGKSAPDKSKKEKSAAVKGSIKQFRGNGLAIASLVLGILAVILFLFLLFSDGKGAEVGIYAFLLGVPAIIFAVIALKKHTENKGIAIAGLILGIISSLIPLPLFILSVFDYASLLSHSLCLL